MCIDILISRAVNQSILISRAVSQPALTHPYTCVWIHVLACIVQELECIFDVRSYWDSVGTPCSSLCLARISARLDVRNTCIDTDVLAHQHVVRFVSLHIA